MVPLYGEVTKAILSPSFSITTVYMYLHSFLDLFTLSVINHDIFQFIYFFMCVHLGFNIKSAFGGHVIFSLVFF